MCRHFDNLDAIFESDTCADLRQLICAFQARRQVFDAAQSSLNTINLAVFDDNEPFVRTVERFGASLPRSAASASWKSPVEMPRK